MRLAESINSVLRLADLRLMRASGYARLQQLASGTISQDRASTVTKTDGAASRGLSPYRERCLKIFGRELARGDNPLLWSFDYESPESDQLFGFMYGMKCARLGKYMETIKFQGLEGAIVEFGVNDGASLNHLVEKCEDLGLQLPIFGFDSFEGLPEVSEHDLSCFHAGQFAAPSAVVAQTLKCHQRKHVHLVKGWFSETLATQEIVADPSLSSIAFAHVDCDLYTSAVDCLKFLEGRLIDGAFLVFDDWTFSELYGETKAFFEWFDRVGEFYQFEDIAYLDRGSVHMRVWLR